MAAMAVDDDLVAATVAYLCAKAACDTGQTNTTKKPKKKSTPRRWWVHPILKERENHGYSSSLIPRLKAIDGGKYTNFLRISAPLFEMLLCMVAPAIMKKDTCWRDAIPSETRLHLTLRFLATGENFKSLHYQFRVGQTTVGKIVQETCAALWTALSPIYVAFPKTSKDWEKIASEFAEKWQLPNCLGAIDGKHVRIQRPKNTNSLNCNYKRYFSKVLFAVADANYKFIYVDIGNYGSEGDSGILSKSKFGRKLFSGKLTLPTPSILPNSRLSFPYYFIGDQAFPLRKDLLRPYKRPTQSQIKEKIYNYRLCRARRVVENAFGMLANRFRVFRVELIVSEKTCDLVVAASIALHNFLLHEKCQKYCPPQFPDCENGITHAPRNGSWRDDTTPVMGLTPQSQQGSSNSARFIIENRDRLANYFATDGKVDWQDTAICKGYYM